MNVIVEGDSPLAIQMTHRLQCGSQINKVMNNWHLAQIIQGIKDHLGELKLVEFSLVRLSTNMFAKRVENKGVESATFITTLA